MKFRFSAFVSNDDGRRVCYVVVTERVIDRIHRYLPRWPLQRSFCLKNLPHILKVEISYYVGNILKLPKQPTLEHNRA